MKRTPERLPFWRGLLIVVLAAALGIILIAELVMPFRRTVARRFVGRGDSALLVRDFDGAAKEYAEALRYDKDVPDAADRSRVAIAAKTDIVVARPFFKAHGLTAAVEQIDEATKEFDNPKAALEAGTSFFASGEYSYARYPIESAVRLDPSYAEAWHYLAQTYDKLAEIDPSYKGKATEAYAKRDALTGRYLVPAQ